MARLLHGDCRPLLAQMPANCVDAVVTDPPYFIDGMGADWNDGALQRKTARSGVIGGLPVGMKFDRRQGEALQTFMLPVAEQLLRVLRPGGFCIVFSQARLYHRMAMSFDLAGFEIRDMLAWKYEGQAKAFSQTHFIKKDPSLTPAQKERLIRELEHYKTPQLKPQMEPMVMAQKPREGTFVENWRKHGVGLVDMSQSLDGRCPGNVMAVAKHRNASGEKTGHLTVKPVELIGHLIRLFSAPGQTVLDPFMGSGSHAVAALANGRNFVGMEIEEKYFQIVRGRLHKANFVLWQGK